MTPFRPFAMVPGSIVRCSRRKRLRDKRPASEIEALLELQAIAAIGDMPPSLNKLAQSFGWSRTRLRSAHDRWLIAAAHAGDPTVIPALPVRS